jgi:ABC-type bacteriocin/lantibiotic exporter with double-glycine peptidase domain
MELVENYISRIYRALEELDGGSMQDPLESCATALEREGMRLTASHMALSEAVWHAHMDSPVVVWSPVEERFFLILQAGAFRVRLIKLGESVDQREVTSRSALAKMLGLSSVRDVLEVGIVHPKLMSENASIQSADDAAHGHDHSHDHGHGHGHEHGHEHMPPFRRFLKILQPERREIWLLLVFAVFASILYLALPLVVDTVVTNLAFGAQTQPFFQALVVIGQILAACLLLQALIVGFQYYVGELIQRRIIVRIAGDLSYRLPRVAARALDHVHAPELVNRFLDSVTLQKNTAFFLLDGINVVVATLIGLVLLALYHFYLMIFVVILIVVVCVAVWPLGRRAVKTAIDESLCKYNLVGWFEQVATYPYMFKGRGGYEMAYQRTNELAAEYLMARRQHFRVVIRQFSGLLFISVVASVALLILGVVLVLQQQLTLGQLVASELIMSSIVASIIKLGKKLETWYDTMAATDKLGHLLDLETETEAGESVAIESRGAGMHVEANAISYGYHADHPIIDKLSFKLAPGVRACVCGDQGSGVSTLLDLCFALRHTDQGYIRFDGMDMRAWHLETLRNSMQILRFNEFVSGSVVDNLRLGRADITMDEIHFALKEVGVLDACLKHADGLDTQMQIGGSPFSTRQRVSLLIARALVQKPRLLMIDEILDGLDPENLERLTKIVFDRERPWTVLIATRMPEVREMCDLWIRL